MSRVLVTGGTGFVGKALASRLKRDGHDVVVLGRKDGDIADLDLAARFVTGEIARVYHLAGRTFVPDSWADPTAFYRTNVLGTANVAAFCSKAGAALTYVSACVYGQPDVLPIGEDSPVRPNNPYIHSKYLGEQVCLKLADLYGLRTTIFRPFNIYGAEQSRAFLIPKVVEQVMHAEAIEVESLFPRRDYIYIDDVCDALVVSLQKTDEGHVYNLGSGVSISVEEVIEVAQRYAGTNKSVRSRSTVRSNETMDVVADIGKFRTDFGWGPRFSFADGIAAMIAHLRAAAA